MKNDRQTTDTNMKTTEKEALIEAARIANAGDPDTFWESVQDQLDQLEKDDTTRVQPRKERENQRP